MSFINSIVSVGKQALGWFTGDSTGAKVARTAGLAFVVNQLNNTVKAENTPGERDTSTRTRIDPDTNHSIPIVYGTAFLSGVVTDAVLTNGNQTMWFCVTLSEETGTLLSTDEPSEFTFEKLYWNGNLVTLQTDGVTVQSFTDEDDNTTDDPSGLIKLYPFVGSGSPKQFAGYGAGNTEDARDLFPNWTSTHAMNNLVFCLIRVDYNASKNITGLGRLEFKLTNSMTLPGDVLFDYTTNTLYGAGIPTEDVNSE